MMQLKPMLEIIQHKLNNFKPEIALILGSGLGYLADEVKDPVIIPTTSLPDYPHSTVEGHEGNFIFGYLENIPVMIIQGRIHFYEGYSIRQVTLPVRIAKSLGIETLILTNSAGGLNPIFKPGDLMLITDHINLMFQNPLIGPVQENEVRFPDMSSPYDLSLARLAASVARENGILLHEGVYVGMTGPTYETRSEVKFLRKIGGDAVGMSTVPETIKAVQLGMKVLGISCISNLATGLSATPLSHDEVKETAMKIRYTFGTLIKSIIRTIGHA